MAINDTIRGVLKLDGTFDNQCYSSLTLEQLATLLKDVFVVEIPRGLGLIIVGPNEPNEDQRDALWLRRDFSGNFIGLYTFQKGAWRLVYQQIDQAVKVEWIYRFDGVTPPGFSKVDGTVGNAQIPASIAAVLALQYIKDPTNTFDVYFAVTYDGGF